jgi:gliding motility-associated-like protein
VQATIYIDNVTPLEVTTSAPIEICTDAGQFALMGASATGGYGPLTYSWDNGAGFGDTVVVAPLVTTNYTLTVTDTCGNSIEQSIEIIVKCDIVIPNIFTPNSDGINDFFEILYLDQYPNSRLVIFDRWGKKVYENANYQNNWDGDGHSDGTYFYIVTPSDPDQEEQHGHLTLIREKN